MSTDSKTGSDEGEKRISIVVSATSGLAIVMGIVGIAAGSIAIDFGRRLRTVPGKWNNDSDRKRYTTVLVLTGVSVLLVMLAIFFMFEGHKRIKDAWVKRRELKANMALV